MSAPAAVPESAREAVRAGLERAAAGMRRRGMPAPALEGQLIRPTVAYAVARAVHGENPPAAFWNAALAVQLAHEASLVHDDIVDAASTRRGRETAAAAKGVGPALVWGDHLLTASYRMAARTGSAAFTAVFARAVERTVAGEALQGRSRGRRLSPDEWRRIALGKAGELIGCAAAAAPLVDGGAEGARLLRIGRRIGLVYQMLDDLLDYCPSHDGGKPALGDYARGLWTWPLDELPGAALDGDAEEVAARFHAPAAGGTPIRRCLARLEREADDTVAALHRVVPGEAVIPALLAEWVGRARDAVSTEEARHRPLIVPASAMERIRARVPEAAERERFFAANSRSFRFAARFFPRGEWERVARVYAYCRVTDDLVDRPGNASPAELEALLDEWVALSRRAYEGTPSGLPLLDAAMADMARAGVPFTCAAELAEGMRMDLRGTRFATMAELRVYTHRVASVVGMWIAGLAGVRAPAVLAQAAEMGHAMQLTNILRDVGEDWRRGRLYLPADAMRTHGVTEDDVARMCGGEFGPTEGYRALVEGLMRSAEGSYRCAFRALLELPGPFRRPCAVAAHVYRGIHAEIRRSGCDNLRRRAVTSGAAKGVLAARALWDLWRLERAPEAPGEREAGVRLAGAGR